MTTTTTSACVLRLGRGAGTTYGWRGRGAGRHVHVAARQQRRGWRGGRRVAVRVRRTMTRRWIMMRVGARQQSLGGRRVAVRPQPHRRRAQVVVRSIQQPLLPRRQARTLARGRERDLCRRKQRGGGGGDQRHLARRKASRVARCEGVVPNPNRREQRDVMGRHARREDAPDDRPRQQRDVLGGGVGSEAGVDLVQARGQAGGLVGIMATSGMTLGSRAGH